MYEQARDQVTLSGGRGTRGPRLMIAVSNTKKGPAALGVGYFLCLGVGVAADHWEVQARK
jgi:hypothetical protein